MTQETEREAFESAAVLEGLSIVRHLTFTDDYRAMDTQWRWLGFKHGLMQARARVGRGEVERRKAIAGLHGCRLAARGEYCASCVIQATNYEYQGEEDRRSKPHDYALSAKPVEVGDEHTDDCAINELGDVCDCGIALKRFNVTEK